jgi:hypothetical protein
MVTRIKKGLFVKSSLLAVLLFGIVALNPATHFAQDVAHQICQAAHPQDGPCRHT